MGINIGKIITGVGKTIVNKVTGSQVFDNPFGAGGGSTPSDWSQAAESAAYEAAWYGDRPDLFQKLQSWGAQGVASAARGANDLLARGWYGGTRGGDYANATNDGGGTINLGQGPRKSATAQSLVQAATTAAGQLVAAAQGSGVVQRPIGVETSPTNIPASSIFTSPIFLIGGGLLVVVLLFVLLRRK